MIDGDTLEVQGQRIRLWGIDAPESLQSCTRGGEGYRCGTDAANALDRFIAERPVTCVPHGRPDRYRRTVAICSVAGNDVGGWMVGQGMAVDYPRYSLRAYASQQSGAVEGGRGLWSGEFQMPWDWRSRARGDRAKP